MDESYTGGNVIVQALKAAGVECVFGIISIHNIPIYDAIARQGGIRPITNRSEQGQSTCLTDTRRQLADWE